MANNTVLGLDYGMGGFKLAGQKGTAHIPAHAAPAGKAQYLKFGDEDQDEAPLVEFQEKRFYVGANAQRRGEIIKNFGYDRLTQHQGGAAEYQALLYRGLAEYATVHKTKLTKPITAAIGLPFDMLINNGAEEGQMDAEDAQKHIDAWVLGKHEWTVNGKKFSTTIEETMYLPQAAGALFDYAYDSTGEEIPGREGIFEGRNGFVSIGFNTTEILEIENGYQVDSRSSSSRNGVRFLLQSMGFNESNDIARADIALRNDQLDTSGHLDDWWEEIKANVVRTWPEWNKYGIVAAVGGGVPVLNGLLSTYFGKRLFKPDCPVLSIANGLYKAGVSNA